MITRTRYYLYALLYLLPVAPSVLGFLYINQLVDGFIRLKFAYAAEQIDYFYFCDVSTAVVSALIAAYSLFLSGRAPRSSELSASGGSDSNRVESAQRELEKHAAEQRRLQKRERYKRRRQRRRERRQHRKQLSQLSQPHAGNPADAILVQQANDGGGGDGFSDSDHSDHSDTSASSASSHISRAISQLAAWRISPFLPRRPLLWPLSSLFGTVVTCIGIMKAVAIFDPSSNDCSAIKQTPSNVDIRLLCYTGRRMAIAHFVTPAVWILLLIVSTALYVVDKRRHDRWIKEKNLTSSRRLQHVATAAVGGGGSGKKKHSTGAGMDDSVLETVADPVVIQVPIQVPLQMPLSIPTMYSTGAVDDITASAAVGVDPYQAMHQHHQPQMIIHPPTIQKEPYNYLPLQAQQQQYQQHQSQALVNPYPPPLQIPQPPRSSAAYYGSHPVQSHHSPLISAAPAQYTYTMPATAAAATSTTSHQLQNLAQLADGQLSSVPSSANPVSATRSSLQGLPNYSEAMATSSSAAAPPPQENSVHAAEVVTAAA
ncbi:hypothetical protein GQ42DRAFT_170235 [Ramicandelaber brevisporus]|nr:hypothetical protein GQ42DRAFT_170235 [Ramicandelaber brevisporus]